MRSRQSVTKAKNGDWRAQLGQAQLQACCEQQTVNARQKAEGNSARERRRNVSQVRSAALPLRPRGKIFLSPLAIFWFLDCLGTAGVLSEEKRARFLDCAWSKLLRTDCKRFRAATGRKL